VLPSCGIKCGKPRKKKAEMNKTQEMLITTMEESGKMISACSKLMIVAAEKPLDKKKIALSLHELKIATGNTQALINILIEKEIFERDEISVIAVDKRKQLRKKSSIF
jgi:hypothetical protein